MRENRTYGSEGGEGESLSLPLSPFSEFTNRRDTLRSSRPT